MRVLTKGYKRTNSDMSAQLWVNRLAVNTGNGSAVNMLECMCSCTYRPFTDYRECMLAACRLPCMPKVKVPGLEGSEVDLRAIWSVAEPEATVTENVRLEFTGDKHEDVHGA